MEKESESLKKFRGGDEIWRGKEALKWPASGTTCAARSGC